MGRGGAKGTRVDAPGATPYNPPMTLRTGHLLVNLGTPDAPTTEAVRRYLAEFLSDRRVIDIPAVPRRILLHGVILPRRAPLSAEAYRAIWTEHGSPLMHHSLALAAGVRAELGPDTPVELGMRYGQPSLANALNRLRDRGATRIVVLPLYPQGAASTTGSVLEEIYRVTRTWWEVPAIHALPPFYADPGFIAAWGEVARPVLAEADPEHVLFSFHGLPERQIRKSDPTRTHCLATEDCCDRPDAPPCYRAQCVATAGAIARHLGLAPDQISVSFQSRLGRTPWIRPYTDETLARLAERGVRRVAVLSPSFTADCLETLEEIGLRARADFQARGGTLTLVPSLNAHPIWVRTVAEWLRLAGSPATAAAPQGR